MYTRPFGYILSILAAVGLAMSSCQFNDTAGRAPWPLSDASSSDADTSPTSDTVSVDTGRTTRCRDGVRFNIRTVDGGFHHSRGPFVDTRSVIAQRGGVGPESISIDVLRFQPHLRNAAFQTEIQPTDNYPPHLLTAAASDRILLSPSAGGQPAFRVLDATGSHIANIRLDDDWSAPHPNVVAPFSRWHLRRRTLLRFDGRRFAFALRESARENPYAPTRAIGYHHDGQTTVVPYRPGIRPPVTLAPDGFYFIGRTAPVAEGGNLDLFQYDSHGGVRPVTRTDAYERDAVSTPSALFWNTHENVYHADPTSPEATPIHRGTCSPVAAHDERAVFSCEETPDQPTSHDRPVYGEQLYFFDGSTTRPVETAGGTIAIADIHGPHVAWTEARPVDGGMGTTRDVRYRRIGNDDSVRIEKFISGRSTDLPPVTSLTVGDGIIAWLHQELGHPVPSLRMARVQTGCEQFPE